MLESLNELIGSVMASPWVYLAIFVVCAVDAFLPAAPSETVVIAAAAVAAGARSIVWVVLLAAAGAFAGDHISYTIGRALSGRAISRLLSGERGRAARARAEQALRVRGGIIIIAARFFPGGRTATTITAGALRYPLTRFTPFDALAASCWAVYAGLIGYFAGGIFGGNNLLAVAAGIGISLGLGIVAEIIRFLARRHRERRNRPRRGTTRPGEESGMVKAGDT